MIGILGSMNKNSLIDSYGTLVALLLIPHKTNVDKERQTLRFMKECPNLHHRVYSTSLPIRRCGVARPSHELHHECYQQNT